MGDQLQQAAAQPEVFLLYEGGEVAQELRTSLTHVRVGPQVKEISYEAFSGCDTLIDLQLNEGLQVIGERAFDGCKSLRSVTLPSTVTKLGKLAFVNCSSLIELQLNEGMQVIDGGAFNGCKSLRSVTLPSTVTELSEFAFYGCSNLAEVRFNNGQRIIGERGFAGCVSLRSVTLPLTVTELGWRAFVNCSSLIELQLNEGLQVIASCAFQGCKSLQSVTLPSTVTKLGDGIFSSCSSLIEVHLNEGLQNIGADAFAFCSALRSVTIPSTVTELGVMAFSDCNKLSEVIFLEGQRLLNQEFFACGFRREEQGLLNQEALNEMFFAVDGEFAFDGCTELRTIKISISWAVSERMARLPRECMLSVEERIHCLSRFVLLQDGEVLVCFPVWVCVPGDDDSDDETEGERYEVLDTNFETARSLYQVLQLIAFHELKESSILVELALWKSIIEKGGDRACRVAIPGPAKILIMEYCGFAGVLRPAF